MVDLNKLKLVLDASKIEKPEINKEVFKVKKKEKIEPAYSFFSMINDVFEKKAKLYRIKQDVKNKSKIPEFKFL